MIKTLLLIIFFLTHLNAQWEIAAPYPIPDNLYNSYFFNDSSGFINGTDGVLYRSYDAFNSFEKFSIASEGKVLQYEFVDDSAGYVIMSNAEYPNHGRYIFKTTDAGSSWSKLIDSLILYPSVISFINRSVGWATVYRGLIFTSDGGESWTKIFSNLFLHKLEFITADKGYGVKENNLYFTTNGGVNWARKTMSEVAHDIIFKDSLNGFALLSDAQSDYAKILLTSDGGINWTMKTTDLVIGFRYKLFYKDSTIIAFFDPNGQQNEGIRSDDAGNTWSEFSLDPLFEPWMANYSNREFRLTNEYYYYFGAGGFILRSTDRGENWENKGSKHGGDKIQFVNSLYGFNAPWYITSDGGSTWKFKEINLPSKFLADYFYFTPDAGLIAIGNKILKTLNGGLSWDTVWTNYTRRENTGNFFFFDSLNGFVLNSYDPGYQDWRPGIRKTTDGGNSWGEFLIMPLGSPTNNISFISKNVGFIYDDEFGYPGFRSTDGGESWQINEFASSTSISFIDSLTGFAVQDILMKTTDGGETFTLINDSISIKRILFVDSLTGWMSSGKRSWITEYGIYLTTDGGISWIYEFTPHNQITQLYLKDKNNLFAAGGFGNIFHRSTTITSTWNSVPQTVNDYFLSNNYPNPFNPSTTINYAIPEYSSIVITIYDILGNELEKMKDEKPAGKHTLTWNAEGIPSGVYFYQLRVIPTGKKGTSFVETKKMLLIK